MSDDADGGALARAVAAHDAAVAARGLEIWLGHEPTFTDRFSQATEWLTGATGEDKTRRAEALVASLARERPGDAILRSIGRQYPGEPCPRASVGLYGRRDGAPVWRGPPDPLLAASAVDPEDPLPALQSFGPRLAEALAARGFVSHAFAGLDDTRHAVAEAGGGVDPSSAAHDERLRRPSIHAGELPPEGLHDPLARAGIYLLVVSRLALPPGGAAACVELPELADVARFLRLLDALGTAATAAGLATLVLRGYPPPVDPAVRWATVTPDPAVVEINAAPHPTVGAFLRDNQACHRVAASLRLAPYRLHYNGEVADSGGGGQMTFGGPSPAASPFFVQPRLLPRLVRYVTRHPSLSYLYAHDHVGPFGQSVRPDELGDDVLAELRLALSLLEREAAPAPAIIWRALAPFLTDASGNSHRAELNIEKLWNTDQPGRGTLGLVEFRALRMQHTPERAAAVAALLRAILAHLMLAGADGDQAELVAWHTRLHDRFGLPFYLEADLREVLAELAASGLGLEPPLVRELARDEFRAWATVELGGCRLEVRRALEFWFLVGDATRQQGTSRLVDSSTSRLELSLRPPAGAAASDDALAGWTVRANGIAVPLRREADPRGPLRLFGVRYRRFDPRQGLHPTLAAQAPLRLHVRAPGAPLAHEITLHEWSPGGGNYDGAPVDLAAALGRRTARCVVRAVPADTLPAALAPAAGAVGECTLDLRYGGGPPARPAPFTRPCGSAAAWGES